MLKLKVNKWTLAIAAAIAPFTAHANPTLNHSDCRVIVEDDLDVVHQQKLFDNGWRPILNTDATRNGQLVALTFSFSDVKVREATNFTEINTGLYRIVAQIKDQTGGVVAISPPETFRRNRSNAGSRGIVNLNRAIEGLGECHVEADVSNPRDRR